MSASAAIPENPATSTPETVAPSSPHVAVQLCCAAYFQAMSHRKRDDMDWEVKARASQEYRNAMPYLSLATAADFLACLTHGMLLGAIEPREGTQFLHAVKVAQSGGRVPNPVGPPRKDKQSATNPSSDQASTNPPAQPNP